MNKLQSILTLMIIVVSLLFITIYVSDAFVGSSTNKLVYNEIEQLPFHNVGLLLGTSKNAKYDDVNSYYMNRIQAAVSLYKNGKIKYVLVSGDNSSKFVNEPEITKRELVKAGIPESNIYLDHAGVRTLDSVIRSNKIFGQNKITIISQKFQNERALFIAKQNGIEAVGFNAKDIDNGNSYVGVLREKLARVKMIMDIAVGVGPKQLGERVEIGCGNMF